MVFGTPGAGYIRPYLTDGCRRIVALGSDQRIGNTMPSRADGRAISDNCQRGAVKAIATFTGLGCALAGEDIPKEESNGNAQRAKASTAKKGPTTEVPAEAQASALPSTVINHLLISVPQIPCSTKTPMLAKWR